MEIETQKFYLGQEVYVAHTIPGRKGKIIAVFINPTAAGFSEEQLCARNGILEGWSKKSNLPPQKIINEPAYVVWYDKEQNPFQIGAYKKKRRDEGASEIEINEEIEESKTDRAVTFQGDLMTEEEAFKKLKF